MAGIWKEGKPPTRPGMGGLQFIGEYGGLSVVVDPLHVGEPKIMRRVAIAPYFIQHESWGSSVHPMFDLKIELASAHTDFRVPFIGVPASLNKKLENSDHGPKPRT